LAAAWCIQIHGALAHQRSLALRLTQLRESGFVDLFTGSVSSSTAIIVESLPVPSLTPGSASSHAARVFHHIARDHRHDLS
jgi:hypothetical protein